MRRRWRFGVVGNWYEIGETPARFASRSKAAVSTVVAFRDPLETSE